MHSDMRGGHHYGSAWPGGMRGWRDRRAACHDRNFRLTGTLTVLSMSMGEVEIPVYVASGIKKTHKYTRL